MSPMVWSMVEPFTSIAALAEVTASVLDATEGLDETAWSTPTSCPGWDVRDQLSHLIGFERLLMGEAAPEVEFERGHVRNPIGEINEPWIAARRGLPGDEVRAEFAEVCLRRLKALAEMSPAEFEVVGWSPIGEVPYSVFMQVRVMDQWVHEQDIREAVGRPGGLGGAGERGAIAKLLPSLGRSMVKGAGAPEGASLALELTGTLPSRTVLQVVDGRAVPAELDEASATLTMSSLTFTRLACGRRAGADAIASGDARAEGDLDLAEAVAASMNAMI